MEAIDEELDALSFGGEKYESLSVAEKNKLIKKLQTEMDKLIKVAMKEDLTTLSLSQINKKSQDLQKRIREIANNPDIKGTVSEGPKADMIDAIYKSENAALTNARQVITKRNSELKYGKKYPVLDPDNNMFIVVGLDERGNPIKMGRTVGRFSATKDTKTGDLSRAEGTSFYDKWNAETNQIRKEGEEVFTNTLNREGKEIMSNPEYKISKTGNMDLQTEFYTNLSTRDLAKKGYKLKQIDMIVKGRKVREYLEAQEAAEKGLDTGIKMHERTDTNEIGAVMEDLYHRGDDVYKMSMKEWITKIPEHFAGGGHVPGFATGGVSNLFRKKFNKGSMRKRLQKDYESLTKGADWMRTAPPKWWLFPEKYGMTRDDAMTWFKERFMYGNLDAISTPLEALKQSPELVKFKEWLEEREGHATGGISNLFRERQGFRSGKAVELVTKLPEFLKFVERLLIKASNEIRRGVGKWKGLDIKQKIVQHDNLTKLATEFQKTKKFDVRINEYTGIDAEKAFVEAQAKVKKGKIWKSSEGKTQAIAMGFDEAGIKGLDQAMKKGTALSDAMKKMGFNVASANDTVKFDALVSEGMIGFSKEMKEQIIRAKYGDVVGKELLERMLVDTNPQRLSEVMGTIDEGVIMHERGMGTDEIITTLKESFKRKPNVEGGLIPGYATGGVSNLFRSR